VTTEPRPTGRLALHVEPDGTIGHVELAVYGDDGRLVESARRRLNGDGSSTKAIDDAYRRLIDMMQEAGR